MPGMARHDSDREGAIDAVAVTLSATRVGRALAACVIGIHVLNVPAVVFRYLWPSRAGEAYATFFGVSSEGRLPTFYSGVTLLGAAMLLGIIAAQARRGGDRFGRHWAGLAAIFVLMAADEMLVIHELSIGPMRRLFGITSGPLLFAWVIPALAFVAGVGAVYLRFVIALPARSRSLIVLAGLVYVGGALGLELASGLYVSARGQDLGYGVLSSIEEVAEMTGIAVLLYALVDYLARDCPQVRVTFRH